MSTLITQLDFHPEYEWWEDDIDYFVDELETKGIMVRMERNLRQNAKQKIKNTPAISFSGFCSQGDGLAFDAGINWSKFFEAYPEVKEEHPTEYLVLIADTEAIICSVQRHGRGNTMYADYDSDDEYEIDSGFFAGVRIGDINGLNPEALAETVKSICETEASAMYKELEKQYEYLEQGCREQYHEEVVSENKDELRVVIGWLLLQGEPFSTRALHIEEASEAIDFEDLDTLGLIDVKQQGGWFVTDKGKELLK